MRRYHVVLSRRIGVAETRAAIARGARPRHFMLHVAELLGAAIHEPEPGAAPARRTIADRILAVPPELAALAERVAGAAADGDVVFSNAETASLAVAARLGARKVRLASLFHNMIRPRITAASTVFGLIDRHAALYSVCRLQASALAARGSPGGPIVEFIDEQIDDAFFLPGPAASKPRPMIASVGLEQRDYRTLAKATAALPADVRISGFSKDAHALARAFPAVLPENMDRRFYEWPDLRRLYRDCDLVVVPLHDNRYAAGITSMLEAMACEKPVIATATTGLRGLFGDEAAFRWVQPGDAAALGREIESLLGDGLARAALAARGARLFAERHRENAKAEEMAARLRALA